MPSVMTIEGASTKTKRRNGRPASAAQLRHRKRMKTASKKCSRLSRSKGIDYRSCMSRELKGKR